MPRKRLSNQLLRRKPSCEALESRLALSGSPSRLMNAEGLTLSFVPDGTKVENQPSSLVATLATKSGIAPWQETIARALQTWAQYANVNVGIVPDGGQPLGIQGPTHDDPRFGDIRVAGIPLSPDTTGEAIGERPHHRRLVGGGCRSQHGRRLARRRQALSGRIARSGSFVRPVA